MREHVGQEVGIRSDGMLYKGIMVEDLKDRVKLNSDGFTVTIPKNKISAILTKEGEVKVASETPKESGLTVYACFNKEMPCKGVRYVRKGSSEPRKVAKEFTRACPLRCGECRFSGGTDLFNLPGKLLAEMLEQTIFGDFPEKG